MTSSSAWGAPINYAPSPFFLRPGGEPAPTAPPGYACDIWVSPDLRQSVESYIHAVCGENVDQWIYFSAIYDLWWYSQKVLKKSGLLTRQQNTCETLRS